MDGAGETLSSQFGVWMIPKKLYFTYAHDEPPELYIWNMKRWATHCSDWEIHYFSDQKIFLFFKENLPEYYPKLFQIPLGVVLADIFRYAVLYVQGGMYMDIDTIPLKPIPDEWLQYDLVVGYELQPSKFPMTPAGKDGYEEVFCQWALLARPKHSLFKELLDQCFSALHARDFEVQTMRDVLEICGPIQFTKVMHQYQNSPRTLLLDMDVFASTEQYLPPTERSVIKHQFHGHLGWQLALEAKHLKLNSIKGRNPKLTAHN